MACRESALTGEWWRDKDTLAAEIEAHHGSNKEIARAHGRSEYLYRMWRRRHGIAPRPKSLPSVPPDQPVPVDDPERLRVEALTNEVAYLRRRTGELDRALASREVVVNRIIEAAKVPVDPVKFKAPPKKNGDLPVRSAVVPIFDIQYGQLVQSQDTPLGLGAYSDAIFRERLARWYEAITLSLRDYSASHRIAELIVALGGDLNEGADIFAGQAWQLEIDPARQTVQLAALLGEAIGNLIVFCKEEIGVKSVMVLSVPGNHGKVGGKKAGATPSTMSWDWLTVEFLRLHLAPYPIDVFASEPGGALLFETMEHLFLLIHGQEIRGWGGIPFYGISRYDGRAIRMSGEIFDYCLMGHHHQSASIPNGSGGEFIVSPDWVGANNLSGVITAASRPGQNLLFVAEKFGITEKMPIYFTPTGRPSPKVYSTTEVGNGRAA